jgi:hypothetical protein
MKTLLCIASFVAVLSGCIVPTQPAQGAPDLAPHRAPQELLRTPKQTARV